MAHLIQIYLPLADNSGKHFERKMFQCVEDELTEAYQGFTSFSRTPAAGLWKSADAEIKRDEIIVYEVLVEELDGARWSKYRTELEKRFEQEKILIRAHTVVIL
jgi:hypothetical protein